MQYNFIQNMEFTQNILSQALEDEEKKGIPNPYGWDCYSAIGRLSRYVFSARFKNTAKTKTALRNFLRKTSEVAAESGVSVHTVRSVRSQISNQLYSIFGSDVFERILSDTDLPALIARIDVLENGYLNVERVLPSYIIESLEELDGGDAVNYSIDELMSEIAFLRNHTTVKLREELEVLDKDRLSFIYSVFLRNGEDRLKMQLLQLVLGWE